jgi:hypothetical protein
LDYLITGLIRFSNPVVGLRFGLVVLGLWFSWFLLTVIIHRLFLNIGPSLYRQAGI